MRVMFPMNVLMFPRERSNVSGTVTVFPHLPVPTTTFNHHMQAATTPTMDHLMYKLNNMHSIRYTYLTCSDHNLRSPYGGEKINPNNASGRAQIVVDLALTISEYVLRYDN